MSTDKPKEPSNLDKFLNKKPLQPVEIVDEGQPRKDLVDELQKKLRADAGLEQNDEALAKDTEPPE